MAHVVRLGARGEAGETRALPLDGPLGPGAAIERAPGAAPEAWVLIAGSACRTLVNGRVSHTGLHVLRGGDEIRTGDGATFLFSTECRVEIEPFPGGDRPVRCGRCTTELEAGVPAVRCPACSSWYHEHGEFNCWSSVPFCQACGHRTAAGSGDADPAQGQPQQES
jgi:hypothetical protein